MMATAPTLYTVLSGQNGLPPLPALVYADAAGSLANVVSPWYLNGNNLYIPAPVGTSGAPLAELAGSLVPVITVSNFTQTASGTITGASYTATTTGKLLTQFILANPAVANPSSALILAQAAGSSALTATTYYVAQAQTNANGSTTVGNSQASLAVTTAGNNITTAVTLETGATGIAVYVGTASPPLELATVSASGAITYSGGATSGLAVSVSGSTLSLTISGAATSTGASEPASNFTAGALVLSETVTPSGGTAVIGSMNGGAALTPGQWYTWEQPIQAGATVEFSLSGAGMSTLLSTLEVV